MYLQPVRVDWKWINALGLDKYVLPGGANAKNAVASSYDASNGREAGIPRYDATKIEKYE